MTQITIGTANTYLGRMLKDPEGLSPFYDADILLLQEIDPIAEQIEELIDGSGFVLAAAWVGVGHAVLSRDSVQLKNTSQHLLQKTPDYQRKVLQRFRENPLQTVGRGVLSATFETADGGEVTVLTAHANVPVKPLARNTYLRKLPAVVRSYPGAVVLGGDMNHWPRPRAADLAMAERAGLERVAIGLEPTYRAEGSQHAWIGRVTRNFIDVNAQLDSMLFTPDHLSVVQAEVRDITSDHRAIVTSFKL